MVTVTLTLWGVLPILLKLGLNYYSAGTIAWFRFFFSFFQLSILNLPTEGDSVGGSK